ncbi:iron permease FTR1/Fip1/EfeU [Suillus subalutaceus]|uniref:iron permease FTR1/Fip1/EfeU n=1 Tax=Suillus subalutaceus TaxID=48586 RepID=UPI001B86877F|nr:iron permease FTR1/Fip1/EfeU [Suillus subalutaceus]KAG1862534.1 iron permease FTR1/Fip1/EfeU [Suillus subalutaceus]
MTAQNLFSVSIFFIVFRESLEAVIIVSVLLGLVEQIVHGDTDQFSALQITEHHRPVNNNGETTVPGEGDSDVTVKRRLIRKLRMQVFAGAGIGLFLSFALVWFTKASDLWVKAENLWEGIFELIASLMIFVMGITMLKLDRAKAKWRVKLQRAFSDQHVDRGTRTGKWVLFILPMITVLREGIEAVVFVGGVALGQPAESIPIAAIVGLTVGLICGYFIYQFASRSTLTIFLIVMTNLILLIGAGLFSKAVWSFQENAFNNLLGADVDDEGGNGPGTYDVRGNVWHLDCCNPETDLSWGIFNAILGWENTATQGSVLSYVFYWLLVVVVLVRMKFKEGRTKLLWLESAAGTRRRLASEKQAEQAADEAANEKGSHDHIISIAESPVISEGLPT